jgi:hypothetical protein
MESGERQMFAVKVGAEYEVDLINLLAAEQLG